MKAKYVVILVILFGLGGFFSRVYLFPSKLEKSANSFFENNIKGNTDKSLTLTDLAKPNDAKNKITEVLRDKDKNAKLIASVINCSKLREDCQVNNPAIKQMEKAGKEENFSKTAKTITTLIDSLSGNDANKKKQNIEKMKKVLDDNTLDYNALLNLQKANNSVNKSWVNAIYIYQAKNIDKGIQPDGIITSGGKTEATLKEELSK